MWAEMCLGCQRKEKFEGYQQRWEAEPLQVPFQLLARCSMFPIPSRTQLLPRQLAHCRWGIFYSFPPKPGARLGQV